MQRISALSRIVASVAAVLLLQPVVAIAQHGTVLYNFGKNGTDPVRGLVLDAKGNLYGTTFRGHGDDLFGTAFRLSSGADGWSEEVLHVFGGIGDGIYPDSNLTTDAAGNVYGTTLFGYPSSTVFELSPLDKGQWTERILYAFDLNTSGSAPEGGMIFDGAGDLYGTTSFGGQFDSGAVFELRPTAEGLWYTRGLCSPSAQRVVTLPSRIFCWTARETSMERPTLMAPLEEGRFSN